MSTSFYSSDLAASLDEIERTVIALRHLPSSRRAEKELLRHSSNKRVMRKSKLARAEAQVRDGLRGPDDQGSAPRRRIVGGTRYNWEGDLHSRCNGSQNVTLVSRQSRFTSPIKDSDREAAEGSGIHVEGFITEPRQRFGERSTKACASSS